MTVATHDPTIVHAARRGAVRIAGAPGALAGWPPTSIRCTVLIDAPENPGHRHPLKTDVTPVMCGICGGPADWACVRQGIDLCDGCARDEIEAAS